MTTARFDFKSTDESAERSTNNLKQLGLALHNDESQHLEIKLTDVLISSYQTGGSGGDQPLEEITLNYAEVEWTYG